MPERRRNRSILSAAWLLALLALLLTVQFGWVKRSIGDGDNAGTAVSAPALVSFRRHAAAAASAGASTAAEQASLAADQATPRDNEQRRRLCQPPPATVPKVALMFLVRGPIFHERTWAAWLDDAAGLVPTTFAAAACCGGGRGRSSAGSHSLLSDHVADSSAASGAAGSLAAGGGTDAEAGRSDSGDEAAAASDQEVYPSRRRWRARSLLWAPRLQGRRHFNNQGIVQRQALFTVYVHSAPSFQAYPRGHLFHGLEVPDRVQVEWGHHSVTRAMRLLLAAALADPANARFQFLDETAIPLHPPQLLWSQLMGESKTRMSACSSQQTRIKWEPELETGALKQELWRKSSQWSMIQRRHAEVLAADRVVWDAITPICEARRVLDPVTNTTRYYSCVSDEHYLPTVLAVNGLSDETTCAGNAVHADWSRVPPGSDSPFTYFVEDVNLSEINRVRSEHGRCDYMGAIRDATAPGNFETAASLASLRCPRAQAPRPRSPYSHRVKAMIECPLFARKFAASTAARVYEAFTTPGEPAGVLAEWRAAARQREESSRAVPAWLRQLPCLASGGCKSEV